MFKVIVVNYIFYNFVESEILGVCIIVFVFIFYDIRNREKLKDVVMSLEWFGFRFYRKF